MNEMANAFKGGVLKNGFCGDASEARKLAIRLLEDYADIPNEFTCDEDFDDFMSKSLQDGVESVAGLIAMLYWSLRETSDMREKLDHYEYLKNRDLLIEIPCKRGDDIYRIETVKGKKRIERFVVDDFRMIGGEWAAMAFGDAGIIKPLCFRDFGRTVFLTWDEAAGLLGKDGK